MLWHQNSGAKPPPLSSLPPLLSPEKSFEWPEKSSELPEKAVVPLSTETVNLLRTKGQAKVGGTFVCVCGAIFMVMFRGPVIFGLGFDNWHLGVLCLIGNCMCVAAFLAIQALVLARLLYRKAVPEECTLDVYFKSEEVKTCIVTCGGLCPGINTVIREIAYGLNNMYGVNNILGIEGGYRGFYSRNTMELTPKNVNYIHKRGGTILQTSPGGHDANKIVDNIPGRGINQVMALRNEEVEKRRLRVAVAGIPKTIDNDIAKNHLDILLLEINNTELLQVIEKSFGFDIAVEEAQRAINAAHVEVESVENGVGIVKLMGRYSGFIAMFATLASRDVDCCLIPESPFYLEGEGGLYEYVQQRLKENRHVMIVLAEGAGQEYVSESADASVEKDASGNKLLLDISLWLTQKMK
ncbi:ATP-dependent 6-phosphofructokinase 4, chloroplastic isoform X2, partial [Tanacetum coccineum]